MQPHDPYKISNKTNDFVAILYELVFNSRGNVTMNNWFTGNDIMEKILRDHRLTIAGTIRKNKKLILNAFV